MRLRTQKALFAGTSRLTDAFPAAGARLLDGAIRPALGSRTLTRWYAWRNRAIVRRPRALRRFLVLPDIHIGDAVMTQPALAAVRDFFPEAEIDYAANRMVAPLIEGHPDATRVLPLLSGAKFPSPSDVAVLRDLVRDGGYDLCFTFSPFLERDDLAARRQPFISFMAHAPALLRGEADAAAVNHFSYQHYAFVRSVLALAARAVRPARFPGTRTIFSDEVIEAAARFAASAGLTPGTPVVMVNPDGASRFTLLPFDDLVALLRRLAAEEAPDAVFLVGAGHSVVGIGARLREAVPAPLRDRLRIIPPEVPLPVYAALQDYADVFLTGDTGPLHLAAARRHSRSGRYAFRNRTAILSWFGATMPRMSGYDTTRPGYLAPSQDAPAWCYQAGSPCRNVTCLNKYFKTCRTVRCFERVDVAALAKLVGSHLRGRGGPPPHQAAAGPQPVPDSDSPPAA